MTINKDRVSLLDRRTLQLPIPDEAVTALDVRHRSSLHAALLLREGLLQEGSERPREDVESPLGMIVASPVPPTAWGRGIRVCFTLPPGNGTLFSLVHALEQCGLFARRIQSSEGLDLSVFEVVDNLNRIRQLKPEGKLRRLTRPTAVLTLEVPAHKVTIPKGDEKGEANLPEDNWNLHTNLRTFLKIAANDSPDYERFHLIKAEVVQELAERLKALECDARIEWVSELQTVLTLAKSFRKNGVVKPLESLSVQGTENGLTVDLHHWRKYLDPGVRTSIESTIEPGRANLAAVWHTDPEERTLIAELVAMRRDAIAQFDLVVPGGRLQHVWFEWALRVIKDHGGNLLNYSTEGRLEGRWATSNLTVVFRYTRGGGENDGGICPINIAKIVACFRALQGFPRDPVTGDRLPIEEADPHAQKLLRELEDKITGIERERVAMQSLAAKNKEDLGDSLRLAVRNDSTLHNLKLWYRWPENPTHEYRAHFKRNPFFFTRPLDLNRYRGLYDLERLGAVPSRVRMTQEIIERLCHEDGSVVLVGAHRSGKTTVMNLAIDLINRKTESALQTWITPSENAVAIRINAAVTPPHVLLHVLLKELTEMAESKPTEKDPKSASLRNSAVRVARSFAKSLSSTIKKAGGESGFLLNEFKVNAILAQADFSRKEVDNEPSLEDPSIWSSDVGKAAAMRNTLVALRDALAEVRKEDPELRLIVAMDEVSESAAWGEPLSFPVWRHIIESSEFNNLRWMFSSSRPPSEAVGYSPISNALREFYMEPLSEVEVSQLVGNFSKGSIHESVVEEVPDEEKLIELPMAITYDARVYLQWLTGGFPYPLQVLCVHLYEQAISDHIPLITRSLIRHIASREAIPDLSRYFAAQWSRLTDEEQSRMLQTIRNMPDVLSPDSRELPSAEIDFDPVVLRAMQRTGLGRHDISVDGRSVLQIVPLFSHWARLSGLVDPDSRQAR